MNDPAGAVAVPLMLVVAALSVIARRFGVPSPMLMLVAGTAIAFVPGMPALSLTPAIVLLWLLPPLLYSSGVGMSWRGFRSSLRPIMLLAIGLVLATACAVAALAHYALGMPWAVGFVLGAIVSPPDAVAPIAILRALHLPRRLVTILEGESLVNDATALVTLSFATAAVVTGTFSFPSAVMQFFAILAGEIVLGIVVGWLMLRVRQFAADARAEVLLALATPYIAFWPAHAAGGSGVIACVASGLYVSWNGRKLIRPDTRLQGYFIWDLVVWATEAVIFFLAGLQAREVFAALGDGTWTRAVVAGVLVTLAVVAVRFAWVFAASHASRALFPRRAYADATSDSRFAFMIAFCGLRGAVSLVAALLVPATIDGAPFPDRNFVLFATYCVVVFTLVGLGSSLPAIARWLGIDRVGADEASRNAHEEQDARLRGIEAAQRFVDGAGATAAEARALLADELSQRRAMAMHRREGRCGAAEMQDVALRLQMIGAERAAIAEAYEANHLTDEARRRIERELDLEEARLRQSVAR